MEVVSELRTQGKKKQQRNGNVFPYEENEHIS